MKRKIIEKEIISIDSNHWQYPVLNEKYKKIGFPFDIIYDPLKNEITDLIIKEYSWYDEILQIFKPRSWTLSESKRNLEKLCSKRIYMASLDDVWFEDCFNLIVDSSALREYKNKEKGIPLRYSTINGEFKGKQIEFALVTVYFDSNKKVTSLVYEQIKSEPVYVKGFTTSPTTIDWNERKVNLDKIEVYDVRRGMGGGFG